MFTDDKLSHSVPYPMREETVYTTTFFWLPPAYNEFRGSLIEQRSSGKRSAGKLTSLGMRRSKRARHGKDIPRNLEVIAMLSDMLNTFYGQMPLDQWQEMYAATKTYFEQIFSIPDVTGLTKSNIPSSPFVFSAFLLADHFNINLNSQQKWYAVHYRELAPTEVYLQEALTGLGEWKSKVEIMDFSPIVLARDYLIAERLAELTIYEPPLIRTPHFALCFDAFVGAAFSWPHVDETAGKYGLYVIQESGERNLTDLAESFRDATTPQEESTYFTRLAVALYQTLHALETTAQLGFVHGNLVAHNVTIRSVGETMYGNRDWIYQRPDDGGRFHIITAEVHENAMVQISDFSRSFFYPHPDFSEPEYYEEVKCRNFPDTTNETMKETLRMLAIEAFRQVVYIFLEGVFPESWRKITSSPYLGRIESLIDCFKHYQIGGPRYWPINSFFQGIVEVAGHDLLKAALYKTKLENAPVLVASDSSIFGEYTKWVRSALQEQRLVALDDHLGTKLRHFV